MEVILPNKSSICYTYDHNGYITTVTDQNELTYVQNEKFVIYKSNQPSIYAICNKCKNKIVVYDLLQLLSGKRQLN